MWKWDKLDEKKLVKDVTEKLNENTLVDKDQKDREIAFLELFREYFCKKLRLAILFKALYWWNKPKTQENAIAWIVDAVRRWNAESILWHVKCDTLLEWIKEFWNKCNEILWLKWERTHIDILVFAIEQHILGLKQKVHGALWMPNS